MKGNKPPPLINTSIQLDFLNFSPSSDDNIGGAFIPYHYIEDENLRLRIYQRLSFITVLKHINIFKNLKHF